MIEWNLWAIPLVLCKLQSMIDLLLDPGLHTADHTRRADSIINLFVPSTPNVDQLWMIEWNLWAIPLVLCKLQSMIDLLLDPGLHTADHTRRADSIIDLFVAV